MFNTIIIYYILWRSWNCYYGLCLPLLVFVYSVPSSVKKKLKIFNFAENVNEIKMFKLIALQPNSIVNFKICVLPFLKYYNL